MNASDWLIGISALATLAAAAFLSISQNRRIRDEDKQSDTKRRRLDDIRNWVMEAIRFFAQQRSMQSKHELELQIADLEPIWAEKASVVRASSAFNKNFQEAVKQTTKNLEEYFNLLNRIIMQLPQTTEKSHVLGLRETTRKSLVKLLEAVADLKVKLQL